MLTQISPDLFLRRVPYRAMGLSIGRQLVVVRLPSGGLWIHSPIPWSPALRTAVAQLGEVRHVIGPNCYHDECLREFQAEYPEAQFHAAPGLARSRRDIHFVPASLGDESHPDWAGVLNQHLVAGMPKLNEIVFLHQKTRSLIIADLAFNLGPDGSWLLGLIMRLNGAWGRFTPTRFARSMIKDPSTVRASLDRILSWDFDRIIVGHGHNIETGGKKALRDAFAFLNP